MKDDLSAALTTFASCAKNLDGVQTVLNACKMDELPISIHGPQGSFLSVVIGLISKDHRGPILVVTPTEKEADLVADDLRIFAKAEILELPSWGTLPYSRQAPLPSVYGRRADTLNRLLTEDNCIVVTPLRSFINPIPDPIHISSNTMEFNIGQNVDPVNISEEFTRFGYSRVPRVTVRGEFSVKGEVIDIFSFGHEYAVRIVLNFDEIIEIKNFDPISQGSVREVQQVKLTSVREVLIGKNEIEVFRDRINGEYVPQNFQKQLIEAVERDPIHDGVEQYYPLFFSENHSVLELLGKSGVLVLTDGERLQTRYGAIKREFDELYRRGKIEENYGIRPKSSLINYNDIISQFNRRLIVKTLQGLDGVQDKNLMVNDTENTMLNDQSIRIYCDPPRSFFGNIPYFREQIHELANAGFRIYVFAVYESQVNRIRAMIGQDENISNDISPVNVEVLPYSISSGFSLPECRIMVIQENEIFGRKRRLPSTASRAPSAPVESFIELNERDFVVHVSYGIGLYHGISRMSAAGIERDYMEVEYSDQERIFVPIEQVNLVQRYIGKDGIKPRLDRIGGKSWETRKLRVRKAVAEMADRLVELYSERLSLKGYSFPTDNDWNDRFDAAFEYQETEDQIRCIEEVKTDMEAVTPMDRLVCGDVGFGKTEVALRAAFKAVMGGKQVAVLTPTTILAEQHYSTFCDRFSSFPVEIRLLSRLLKRGEQKKVIESINKGVIDIVIGTHRLVQNDVIFDNLGLLVVDEEQRFGVRHKERLKEIKKSVDCLTLTATPIPRTLHMSLAKIRDMSVINTAPQNRLPVETFIKEYDEQLVSIAIKNEIKRGGQVFYLHNRVRTISEITAYLNSILPEAGFAIAHGKMDPSELEEVMRGFIAHECDVLVSTSIIENGLDIPNVNTIIIDRADMFGIAQLYQLRGRVGRSERTSYAYLFYPPNQSLSEIAMKRLKVISDFTDLGSGFKVALKDMEVRGAGNILGAEQSGEILAVGYDMYIKLLEEAIGTLRGDPTSNVAEVYLEFEYAGSIPDSYVDDPMVKIEVYKRVASIQNNEQLSAIHAEIIDRFGAPPDSVLSMLAIAEIRIACRRLSISNLKENRGRVCIEFENIEKISIENWGRIISDSRGKIFMDSKQPNCIMLNTEGISREHKSEYISEKLNMLIDN